MLTAFGSMRRRMKANLEKFGTDVTLTWDAWTGGTLDPVTGAHVGGTKAVQTQVVKGWVYEVPATSGLKTGAGVEVGDVILDLAADVVVDGRESIRFTVDGLVYEAKDIPERLARSWDVVFSGQRTTRTLLLRRCL